MSVGKQKNNFNFSFFLMLLISVLGLGAFIIKSTYAPCANSLSCKESLKLSVNNDEQAVFAGQKITPPKIDLSAKEPDTKVLGETVGTGEKHIYVDLTTQTLSAYQGDTLFMQVPVSTGKWGKTPAGEYTIWEKVVSTKMSGGSGADYYYLPNVPYVMFFEGSGVDAGRGYSLHGAYWHNNFGHVMSHGCVNMRQVDAAKLFYWATPVTDQKLVRSDNDNPGTKITIYGESI